jgi:hypothetical protein
MRGPADVVRNSYPILSSLVRSGWAPTGAGAAGFWRRLQLMANSDVGWCLPSARASLWSACQHPSSARAAT